MTSYSKNTMCQKTYFLTVLRCFDTKLCFRFLTWKYDFWHENMILTWKYTFWFRNLESDLTWKYDFSLFWHKNIQPGRFRPYNLVQDGQLRTYTPSCPKHRWRSGWYPLIQDGDHKAPFMVQQGPTPCWPPQWPPRMRSPRVVFEVRGHIRSGQWSTPWGQVRSGQVRGHIRSDQ